MADDNTPNVTQSIKSLEKIERKPTVAQENTMDTTSFEDESVELIKSEHSSVALDNESPMINTKEQSFDNFSDISIISSSWNIDSINSFDSFLLITNILTPFVSLRFVVPWKF